MSVPTVLSQTGSLPTAKRRRLFSHQATGNDCLPNGITGGGEAAGGQPSKREEDDLNYAELPTDLEAAIQLLLIEFPRKSRGTRDEGSGSSPARRRCPEFALKSQIYSIIADSTKVDKELDNMKHCNAIRVFQLGSGPNDIAVMPSANYCALIEAARRNLPDSGPTATALQRFQERVLPQCCDSSIAEHELLAAMNGSTSSEGVACSRSAADGEESTVAPVTALIQAGFLTRHPSARCCYRFAVPDLGSALRALAAGRKELCRALARRRLKDMLESDVAKLQLQSSWLGVRFHLRDLLGQGLLQRVGRPGAASGAVVRLVSRVHH